jgi:hypothetical protein
MNKYYSRKWLNKQGTGFIECAFDDSIGGRYKEAHVKFGDCNRMATIDLSMGTKQEKAAKLQKITIMIDELIALKEQLEKVEIKK